MNNGKKFLEVGWKKEMHVQWVLGVQKLSQQEGFSPSLHFLYSFTNSKPSHTYENACAHTDMQAHTHSCRYAQEKTHPLPSQHTHVNDHTLEHTPIYSHKRAKTDSHKHWLLCFISYAVRSNIPFHLVSTYLLGAKVPIS